MCGGLAHPPSPQSSFLPPPRPCGLSSVLTEPPCIGLWLPVLNLIQIYPVRYFPAHTRTQDPSSPPPPHPLFEEGWQRGREQSRVNRCWLWSLHNLAADPTACVSSTSRTDGTNWQNHVHSPWAGEATQLLFEVGGFECVFPALNGISGCIEEPMA